MPAKDGNRRTGAKPVHPHRWLWEPLESDPSFVLRPMFGTRAAYIGGRLTLCFCAGPEPWRGLLICTGREQHDALSADFPALTPHPILPKWLYLAESHDRFEAVATQLVQLVRRRDPRIGVTPGAKKPKRKAASRPHPARRGPNARNRP